MPRMGHESTNLNRGFESTRWSLVVAAATGAAGDRQIALKELCELYWRPIYAYARRKGRSKHDAEDLTQAFFARLLEKNSIAAADPERGRFRSFLLSSFANFMANQWDKETAKKRGGGQPTIQLDFEAGEQAYSKLRDDLTAEQLFERQWIGALLDRVVGLLRAEYKNQGKLEKFEAFKPFLSGKSRENNFRSVAADLGMTENAAMSTASRMRRRYKELLRNEISHTVANPDEIEDEIKALFRSFS